MLHIKRTIDLTGENFWRIDTQEAEIIEFDYCEKEFETVEFEIWGIRILVGDFWEHDKSFLPGVPHNADYYVSGKGRIRVENVSGISVIFSPYPREKKCTDFYYDSLGRVIRMKWSRGKTVDEDNSYLWECPMEIPLGFARIFIQAQGPVTYEFDDKNMILEKEFLNDPMKYCYLRRILNS